MDTSGVDQRGISGCHFLGVLIDVKHHRMIKSVLHPSINTIELYSGLR